MLRQGKCNVQLKRKVFFFNMKLGQSLKFWGALRKLSAANAADMYSKC